MGKRLTSFAVVAVIIAVGAALTLWPPREHAVAPAPRLHGYPDTLPPLATEVISLRVSGGATTEVQVSSPGDSSLSCSIVDAVSELRIRFKSDTRCSMTLLAPVTTIYRLEVKNTSHAAVPFALLR